MNIFELILVILMMVALFVFILELCFIYKTNKREKEKYKNFVNTLTVGQRYSFEITTLSDNPFEGGDFKDNVTITDIKKNRNDEVWIKFEFSDGSCDSCSVDDFYQYVVID